MVWWGWVDGRDVTVSFIQHRRGPTPFSQPEDPDTNTDHLRPSCKKVLYCGLSEGVSSPTWESRVHVCVSVCTRMRVCACVLGEGTHRSPQWECCKGNPSPPRTLKVLSAHRSACPSPTRDARGAGSGLPSWLCHALSSPRHRGISVAFITSSLVFNFCKLLQSRCWGHRREAGVSDRGPSGVGLGWGLWRAGDGDCVLILTRAASPRWLCPALPAGLLAWPCLWSLGDWPQ